LPDLYDAAHPELEPFRLGKVYEADAFKRLGNNPRLIGLLRLIRRGIDACEGSCGYFQVCRGGLPANKFGEHKTLEATETTACRFKQQAVTDAVVTYCCRAGCRPSLRAGESWRLPLLHRPQDR
jgi:uncharacterized protein